MRSSGSYQTDSMTRFLMLVCPLLGTALLGSATREEAQSRDLSALPVSLR